MMLGGHLDSWHTGTGAVDNAAGTAQRWRRSHPAATNRSRGAFVALWTGEEEDYFGSVGYVKQHFGDLPPATPARARAADATQSR